MSGNTDTGFVGGSGHASLWRRVVLEKPTRQNQNVKVFHFIDWISNIGEHHASLELEGQLFLGALRWDPQSQNPALWEWGTSGWCFWGSTERQLCQNAEELPSITSRKTSATEGQKKAFEADWNRQEASGNHSKGQVSLSFSPTKSPVVLLTGTA